MNFIRKILPRRTFLQTALGLTVGGLGVRAGPATASSPESGRDLSQRPSAPGEAVPVETQDVPRLPYEVEARVKVFRLVAEPVKREFLPGRVFDLWGYNGTVPGPTIEVEEGDRVRIHFENRLPEPTTVHWHGLEVPIGMDGVPAISQPEVEPGGSFVYEFTLHQHGTFFYHSHGAMQEMLGLLGMFIIHPKVPYQPAVQKDFAIVLQEWAILPNNTVPNTLSMEFNWLTFNGRAGPHATPMIVKLGERVRIRLVNIGMDHHPIHLHGHQFVLTGTEGGRIPEPLWYPQNTVLVGVAQARVIEFEAQYPGDWMFHCHLPHHMMNQMVSMVGPMAHLGHGLGAGKGMEEGMGMVRQAHALSEDLGPSLGRGMGLAATEEQPRSTLVGQTGRSGHGEPGHGAPATGKLVPGYPQDMFMPMDDLVAKPETYGMAPGWSGATMGMMTVIRVLPPDQYEEILRRVKERRIEPPPKAPAEPPGHGHAD